MRKSNLVKAFMIGLCMSALTSGVAFAQMTGETVPAVTGEVQSDEMNELYALQSDIDQYLLVDHVKEIEEKGFMINYTSAIDSFVEIGISPYSDENANYLYEIFGKDKVKVVEFDQSVIFASGVADPAVVDGGIVDDQPTKEEIYTTMENSVDETAVNTDGTAVTPEDKVYKGDTGVAESEEVNPDVIYYTTGADTTQEDTEDPLMYANDAVNSDAKEDTKGMSIPIMILVIAGGSALVGGAIIISNKKKVTK